MVQGKGEYHETASCYFGLQFAVEMILSWSGHPHFFSRSLRVQSMKQAKGERK